MTKEQIKKELGGFIESDYDWSEGGYRYMHFENGTINFYHRLESHPTVGGSDEYGNKEIIYEGSDEIEPQQLFINEDEEVDHNEWTTKDVLEIIEENIKEQKLGW